jgi:ATP-binding cassette subfamily B protein
MTMTDESGEAVRHTPDFAAAHEHEVPDSELGRFRRMFRTYQKVYNVARSTLFWALLLRRKRTVYALFGILIVQTAVLLLGANLTRYMVDDGIVDQTHALEPYLVAIVFFSIIAAAFGFVTFQISEKLGYEVEFDMRVWLYTHIQSADLRGLDKVVTGQLVTRSLTDVQLIDMLLRILPGLIGAAPLLIAIVGIVTVLSPFMGIFAVASVPVNLWMVNKFRDRLRALSWAELNERAEVTAAIDEPVRGIRVVKAFGREERERERVDDVTERAFRYSMTRTRLLARYDLYLRAVPILNQGALLAVGAWLMSTGRLSVGTFLLAFNIGSGLNLLASGFGEFANAWQYLRSAQDRLTEMLALSARPVTDGRMIPSPTTGLELGDVTVAHDDRTFLHGLDLQARGGELVVVTGPPGSGKTLLANIAAGLAAPDLGTATLDGVELVELDPNQLRRTVRVVSEEPLLLAASLRDNLLLGAWGDIGDDSLLAAMRVAGAEEIVDELGGLGGVVGDRGLTVSGGQRQRVSLARALVAHPRVLVLDDALSAVNPSLEVEIMRRVRDYLPDTAILYMTRRPGLGAIADRTVVLEPPVHHEPIADVATSELMDGSAALTVVSETASVLHGDGMLDPVDALDAVDQIGMETEVAEGNRELAATPTDALAAVNPGLAALVAKLDLTEEGLDAPAKLTRNDTRPNIWKIAWHYKGLAAVALVLVLLSALGGIVPSVMLGRVIDIIEDSDGKDLGLALAAAGVLVLVGYAVGFVSKYFRIFASRFTQAIVVVMRRRVFYRLSALGVNFYDRELPGDVATRIVADLDKILGFVGSAGFQLASLAAIFVVAMGAIFFVAPGVMPIVVVMIALMVTVTLIQLPLANRTLTWSRAELGTVTRKFQEDFGARHEIRSLGAHAIQTEKFVKASWRRRRARFWSVLLQNSHTSLVQFLGHMTSVLVLYRAGTLVVDQQLPIGAAITVQLLAGTATGPLVALGPLYNQFLDVRVSWRRLCEPFDEPVFPEAKEGAVPCPRLDGPVTFEAVEFAYPGTDRPVLRGVSFTMAPGEVTALVGYTGAGKSSIAKLLIRTYDPSGGAVTLNGVDLRDLDPATFRNRLGIVPQDPFMFRGTVASNVRYSNPDASDAEVEEALRAVGAWDALSALPDGLATAVVEEGNNLTAAQRQLIALARAWLAKPDILVLDEATSLLDSATEDEVIESLHELGCTTLMITHREAVAAKSAYIVVLQGGEVVDSGPEEQVARPGGPYDALWRTQEDERAGELDALLATRTGDSTLPS